MTDFITGDDHSKTVEANTKATTVNTPLQKAEDNSVLLEWKDRKFSKEDVIKKFSNADSHIETLTAELAEKRKMIEELTTSMKEQINAAELLKKVKEASQAPAGGEQAKPNVSINPDDIVNSVLSHIEAKKSEQQEAANLDKVKQALQEKWGDKVNEYVAKTSNELGMSVEDAIGLARRNPTAFSKLFDVNKQEGQKETSFSKANTQAFSGKPERKATNYMNLRTTKDMVAAYQEALKQFNGE